MNYNKIKGEKKVDSAESTILLPGNDTAEKKKGEELQAEWEAQTERQMKFNSEPKPVTIVKMLSGCILLPKLKIPGYTDNGKIILPDNDKTINEDRLKFNMYPHCVVAKDTIVEGIEVMQYVMLNPTAMYVGEIQIGGVAFFMFPSHEVTLVIEDLEGYMKQDKF